MSILESLPRILADAKALYSFPARSGASLFAENLLVCADNLAFMDKLLSDGKAGSLDFIYVDPPFFTNADWKTSKGNSAYIDKWDSFEDFLKMLTERLLRMKDLLADTGSLAVHLDWHSVHYVKVIMDEIFGEENFINELIWTYKSGGAGKRSFAKKHDTILLYSKSKKYFFEPQKEKSYNRGYKPYHFKGVQEYQDELGWYTLVNHKDILSFDMVGRTSKERCGYPTQKPVKLMELLINSCCPAGGICADFFCGSGSLGVAAHKNGRRFIMCDYGDEAVTITKQRLGEIGAEYKFSKEVYKCKRSKTQNSDREST